MAKVELADALTALLVAQQRARAARRRKANKGGGSARRAAGAGNTLAASVAGPAPAPERCSTDETIRAVVRAFERVGNNEELNTVTGAGFEVFCACRREVLTTLDFLAKQNVSPLKPTKPFAPFRFVIPAAFWNDNRPDCPTAEQCSACGRNILVQVTGDDAEILPCPCKDEEQMNGGK